MNFRRKRQSSSPAKLDLTALLDVIFILNIFFMVNMQTFTPQGLAIELPETTSSRSAEDPYFLISVDDLDQIHVDGEIMGLRGLAAKLKSVPRQKPILLEADRNASYGLAVETFDVLKNMNFKKVTLATRPKKI